MIANKKAHPVEGRPRNHVGSNRTTGRRLPPYGGRLAGILADPSSWPGGPGTSPDGRHPTLWALAGCDGWTIAREWVDIGVLFALAPPGEDPASFDWRLLAGHPPVLIWPCGILPQGDLAGLIAALLRDGAGRVLVLGNTGMRLYRAGGRHAA